MNDYAAKLEMNQTHFDSPHGLQNVENLSTAYDIGKLSAHCLKNEYFRKIVATQCYECSAIRKYTVLKYSNKEGNDYGEQVNDETTRTDEIE